MKGIVTFYETVSSYLNTFRTIIILVESKHLQFALSKFVLNDMHRTVTKVDKSEKKAS